MACLPVRNGEGETLIKKAKASQTFVKGDMLKDDGNGFLQPVSAGDGVDVEFISAESRVSSGTDGDELLVYTTRGNILFVCDTDAAPAQTDENTIADIAAAGQIDPDASTDDIFLITKVFPASLKVQGYFNHANET